jgi:hypothetical protein
MFEEEFEDIKGANILYHKFNEIAHAVGDDIKLYSLNSFRMHKGYDERIWQ